MYNTVHGQMNDAYHSVLTEKPLHSFSNQS